MLTVTVEHNYI